MKTRHIHYGFVITIGCILATLLGITLYQIFQQIRTSSDNAIIHYVDEIEKALRTIDEQCEITSITNDRNYIDFLVVSKFVGSQVGPLTLRFPEKWAGPYMPQNATIKGKQFELIKMKDGYAIVPGRGVRLANGKIIGTDIIFDSTTDIDTLLTPEIGLEFEGKPLIRKLQLNHNVATVPTIIQELSTTT